MPYDFDLFVIGAGSGGVRASRIAANLGAKVAVAEDMFMGGTCVNVGCVPKKLFVHASEFSEEFKAAKGYGWSVESPRLDWSTLRDRKTAEIQRLNGIYKNLLENAGVTVINGRAVIDGPNHVSVGAQRFSAKNILVATGAWPNYPTFPGAEHCLVSNDLFTLDKLPEKILIQGGGYVAVEFAGIFNGLGCEVELVYRGELFLRSFDRQVREFVAKQMKEKGIKMCFGADVASVGKNAGRILNVNLDNGETREVDAMLSAIGRTPKTGGLGLENTRVKTNSKGAIVVDDNFETAEPGIFAIGDVVGRMELTPVALAEGNALARYLFAGEPVCLDYRNIPTAIFCQPEIGTIGLSEEDARIQGLRIDVYVDEFRPLKHTLSGLQDRALVKLVVDRMTDRVIGCHMAGSHAGEIIQGLAVAIQAGATKRDFDRTLGVHPTMAEEFVTLREPVVG